MLDTRFWKKYFQVYDTLNALIPYQELLQSFVDALGPVLGLKILDAGAGTGNLSVLLDRAGAQVTGLDFSPDALLIFKKKLPHVTAITHDLTKSLPFADDTFDAIVSNNVIYTLPLESRPAIFREFFRVLKKGGKVVVGNPVQGFKPIVIYLDHVRKSVARKGFLSTIADVFLLILPTLKIFYYNFVIRREDKNGVYSFVEVGKTILFLENAGFQSVTRQLTVYSGQGELCSAKK